MNIIQHRSIILLNIIKCPHISKPKAKATVSSVLIQFLCKRSSIIKLVNLIYKVVRFSYNSVSTVRSIILLNIKCLSGDRMEKKPWEKPGSETSSPLANERTRCDK